MLKLKNPFKRAKEFIKNRREAEELLKMQNKAKEIEMYSGLIQKMLRGTNATVPMEDNIGTFDSSQEANAPVYFYDFLQEANNLGDAFTFGGNVSPLPANETGVAFASFAVGGSDISSPTLAVDSNIEKIEPKVVVKPKDVFDELERIPDAVNLENLEEKIMTFKMRSKFIKYNNYAKKEVMDMAVRLENRRRYKEFEDFFGKFDCTSTEKINNLISKYDLVLKSSDLFIPTFPKDAIDIMEEYEKTTIELCGKKPIFYVIAENSKFKKEFDRNDPILLAQSPFGIYWNILGAWDEEILLLSEL